MASIAQGPSVAREGRQEGSGGVSHGGRDDRHMRRQELDTNDIEQQRTADEVAQNMPGVVGRFMHAVIPARVWTGRDTTSLQSNTTATPHIELKMCVAQTCPPQRGGVGGITCSSRGHTSDADINRGSCRGISNSNLPNSISHNNDGANPDTEAGTITTVPNESSSSTRERSDELPAGSNPPSASILAPFSRPHLGTENNCRNSDATKNTCAERVSKSPPLPWYSRDTLASAKV